MEEISRELLDSLVTQNLVGKRAFKDLKGGSGLVYIYKDIKPNDIRAYESGNIVLEKGSSIGAHKHIRDSEIYHILVGMVEINGRKYYPGESAICAPGELHDAINLHDGDSIIEFSKHL